MEGLGWSKRHEPFHLFLSCSFSHPCYSSPPKGCVKWSWGVLLSTARRLLEDLKDKRFICLLVPGEPGYEQWSRWMVEGSVTDGCVSLQAWVQWDCLWWSPLGSAVLREHRAEMIPASDTSSLTGNQYLGGWGTKGMETAQSILRVGVGVGEFGFKTTSGKWLPIQRWNKINKELGLGFQTLRSQSLNLQLFHYSEREELHVFLTAQASTGECDVWI